MDSITKDILQKLLHIFLDVACVTLVGLPPILLKYYGSPYYRGFFCDDEDLKHPYLPSTVSWNTTVAVGVLLPIGIIFVVECVKYCMSYASHQVFDHYTIGRVSINKWLWTWYKEAGKFAFGLAFSQSFNDIGKYAIGRLRPYFLTVCKPLASACANGTFITSTDVCTGNSAEIREARLSFPSGHASYVWYCALYLAIYIQVHMKWKGSTLLKHCLSGAALLIACYVCFTRVSDYKHHPSDVIAGAFIGIVGCLLTVYCVSDLWSRNPSYESQPLLPQDKQQILDEKTAVF
ncbi:putative phosphatidate phosphatase [Tubulanus polymorphus]|uniref:putative phosphatidate phosphatase n=1 Tax=Tubulanus polymorphus TaxID=672921 RepID=UPI003DA2F17E